MNSDISKEIIIKHFLRICVFVGLFTLPLTTSFLGRRISEENHSWEITDVHTRNSYCDIIFINFSGNSAWDHSSAQRLSIPDRTSAHSFCAHHRYFRLQYSMSATIPFDFDKRFNSQDEILDFIFKKPGSNNTLYASKDIVQTQDGAIVTEIGENIENELKMLNISPEVHKELRGMEVQAIELGTNHIRSIF